MISLKQFSASELAEYHARLTTEYAELQYKHARKTVRLQKDYKRLKQHRTQLNLLLADQEQTQHILTELIAAKAEKSAIQTLEHMHEQQLEAIESLRYHAPALTMVQAARKELELKELENSMALLSRIIHKVDCQLKGQPEPMRLMPLKGVGM